MTISEAQLCAWYVCLYFCCAIIIFTSIRIFAQISINWWLIHALLLSSILSPSNYKLAWKNIGKCYYVLSISMTSGVKLQFLVYKIIFWLKSDQVCRNVFGNGEQAKNRPIYTWKINRFKNWVKQTIPTLKFVPLISIILKENTPQPKSC